MTHLPELPGIELVLGVLGVPEDEHHDALHIAEVLHQGLGRVGQVLQCHTVELALRVGGGGVFPFNAVPDPYVFRPPGSGSVSQRYGSGSRSFYY